VQVAVRPTFLALLAIALLAYGIERLIVTDAEAIEALAERAGRAVADRDWENLRGCLSEDFHYGSLDRDGTVTLVRRLVERHDPKGIRVLMQHIEVHGDEAQAEGIVVGRAYGRPARVVVSVDLRRVDGDWRIARVEGGNFVR
jgi:DNA-binding GntR family transcriptional regulator